MGREPARAAGRAFPDKGRASKERERERTSHRLRGNLPIRWSGAASALNGRRRAIMEAIVSGSFAVTEGRQVVVQVDPDQLSTVTGLDPETTRRTLWAMCTEHVLKAQGNAWDDSSRFVLFPSLELSKKGYVKNRVENQPTKKPARL